MRYFQTYTDSRALYAKKIIPVKGKPVRSVIPLLCRNLYVESGILIPVRAHFIESFGYIFLLLVNIFSTLIVYEANAKLAQLR